MKVGGIILAGGQSSRMGQEKGLVPFRGKPMVQWVLEAAQTVCDEVLIVANDSLYGNFGVRMVEDEIHGRGPLAGIVAGLRNSSHEVNLILSCDIPLVEPDLLQFLIEQSAGQAVTMAESEGKWHPLVAVYHRSVLPELEQSLVSEELKLRNIIFSLPHRVLDLQRDMIGFQSSWLNNFNSMDEIRDYEQRQLKEQR